MPAAYKLAYIDDYKVTWSSLGHSLGEILYSLPLAPGETVRLAVVDWSRDDSASRTESTALTEELLHSTHRDRSIVETVQAGLRELQRGSSFMAGKAHSGGASGGANLGVVGLGAAVGDTWAIGGSTATTSGSRDLTAENVQRLNDSFAQASSARRDLQSTVVVQARQEEHESIQTRTFSNYNHSHTLTVLYYEVLRHYRVTVEWVRRRRAVLIKGTPRAAALTAETLSNSRFILQPNLLDPSLAGGFDAAARRAMGERRLQRATDVWKANTKTDDPGLKVFTKLIAQFTTNDDDTSEPVFVAVHLKNNQVFELEFPGAGDEGTSPEFEKMLPFAVLWRDLKGIEVKLKDVNSGGAWEVTNILITMVTNTNERVPVLADGNSHELEDDEGTGLLPTSVPPQAVTSHVGPTPSRVDFVSVEDDAATETLLAHVRGNPSYYDRVLWLTADPGAIATGFEAQAWDATSFVADHVDPQPLETFGSYVAYALATQGTTVDDTLVVDIAAALNGNDAQRREWAATQLANLDDDDRQEVMARLALASARSERLNTIPTRGVFAEGKLGHANISEEIDNTRFWKWDEHPIPIEAPGINAVTPISPSPAATELAPTPFPASLVNIVNPSPAPDPAGLGAALSLLGTPNIFRDMSGREEVAGLLKKLSDNSIAIAEAANKAREIQAKYGTDLDRQQKELELGNTKAAADVVKELGNQRREQAQEVTPSQAQDAIKLSQAETRKGNMTPAENKEYSQQVLKNVKGARPGRKSKPNVKLSIDLKGYGNNLLIGRFGVDVEQRGTIAGFLVPTDYSKKGQLVVGVLNEDDDPRYLIEIKGEVLGGLGVNSLLRGRNMVQIPREDFDRYDYFYLVATAQVGEVDIETKDSDEISSEVAKKVGGGIEAGGDIKLVAISAKTEGGVEWKDGRKHTSETVTKLKVSYYKGGFDIAYQKAN